MKTGRSDLGRDLEGALREALAHVRGESSLPCRIEIEPIPLHGSPEPRGSIVVAEPRGKRRILTAAEVEQTIGDIRSSALLASEPQANE